jgi:hypothetical protein
LVLSLAFFDDTMHYNKQAFNGTANNCVLKQATDAIKSVIEWSLLKMLDYIILMLIMF